MYFNPDEFMFVHDGTHGELTIKHLVCDKIVITDGPDACVLVTAGDRVGEVAIILQQHRCTDPDYDPD